MDFYKTQENKKHTPKEKRMNYDYKSDHPVC